MDPLGRIFGPILRTFGLGGRIFCGHERVEEPRDLDFGHSGPIFRFFWRPARVFGHFWPFLRAQGQIFSDILGKSLVFLTGHLTSKFQKSGPASLPIIRGPEDDHCVELECGAGSSGISSQAKRSLTEETGPPN